ncbi:MAG: hypothetical protein ABIZ56_11865 [Chthoniobacteraceae bacterium]
MRRLYLFAAEVQAFCEAQGWRFCFIGGVAAQAWSESRVTKDADLTLITGFGEEDPFVDALLARFAARRPDAREFALRHRVLLLASKSGIGLDVGLGGFDFECGAVDRAVLHEFLPGVKLRVCTAEDFIVFKTFAARPLDWRDVEMTIVRQGDAALDWDYIREQLIPLLELKEQPGLLDELDALRAKRLRHP